MTSISKIWNSVSKSLSMQMLDLDNFISFMPVGMK